MIFKRVCDFFAEQTGMDVSGITEASSFGELGMDSVVMFQVLLGLEEEFGIELDNIENMATVGDVVGQIELQTKGLS